MNWNHIKAVMCGDVRSVYATVDGTRVVSNGYIAFAAPESFGLREDSKEHPAIVSMWQQALATAISPEPIGGCAGADDRISRYIGNLSIIERWVRCFGDGVTWTSMQRTGDVVMLVHRDGVLAGIVMPLKYAGDPGSRPEPTDEEVFGPIACEENGWYLVNIKEIAEKIEELQEDLETAEEKITEAESEADELRNEIAALRKLMGQSKAA